MGFYFKKTIATFLEPLSFIFALLILGLWFLYRQKRKKAIFLVASGIALLFLFSYKPFVMALIHPLERIYPKLTHPPKDTEYIVFIGGDFKQRGWELLRLYNKLPNAKIVVSGYEGDFFEAEATRNKRILTEIGIDKKQIIALPTPRDTIEEAKTVKQILHDKRFILITSAYHMPRAMIIFRHEQTNPIPAPTDFTKETKHLWLSWPNGENLRYTEKALHEYIGLVWLKLKGY